MRVQFTPSGVGLGHAGRCIPIARGLKERNKKTEVFFSTYLDAVNYVRQEGFPTVEVPSMDFQVKSDGTVDLRRTAINPGPFVASFNLLEQIGKEVEIMGTFKPDVVVSDSRATPLIAAKIVNTPAICILNQFQVIIPRRTHYLRLAKFADTITLAILGKIWTSGVKVMIPDFPPPYTISTGNLRTPKAYKKKINLIGPILPVRPDALPSKGKLRKKLGLHDEKPVIFAPISGPLKERAYLISMLQQIFSMFPEHYQIIMSLGDPRDNSSSLQHGNFTTFRWIPNRFEYMKACDVVVSRAGHGTIMQTMCYGKPTILIPTPSHTEQINNARKAEDLGVALIIKQDDLSKKMLFSRVKQVLENKNLRERALEVRSEVSTMSGLEMVVETIIDVVEGGEVHIPA
ncbi:MAG: hypothetical protein JSV51_01005 [Candidatus Bathyarchaeota archaeon]|nr:MAG: hypothetical protein JSV51_01005 [Candidatus Bathyarchaeota archaeon]